MPTTSETGHAQNVANFENLISFCNGYGPAYNPSKDSLTIPQLQDLQQKASDDLQQTKTFKTNFDNATNARQLAFKEIKPLATKILNALDVSGANDLVIGNAKTINHKIQGSKSNGAAKTSASTDSPGATAAKPKTISNSQQGYDSLVDHFTKLLETVSQETNYKPNETELKTATLQIKLAALKTSNTNLINSYTLWSNARIQRDVILYNPLTGLVQTALDVKKYVKSVFGTSSPQFKQVIGLQFATIKED